MDFKDFYAKTGEKPLDNLVTDGGLVGIMRTIGCIGDSLSSGELESLKDGVKGYHDFYDISWGQFMARMSGSTVYNFSKGGMTAENFWKSFGDKCGVWTDEKKCQSYILALGVNDFAYKGKEVGDVSKPDEDTFLAYMYKIISRLKENQPKARIFLVTMPRDIDEKRNAAAVKQTKAMYDLAEVFEYTYVIDLNKYAPVYDEQVYENFFMGGHLNSAGYLVTAKMITSYIDYIIRNNPEDFMNFGFVGRTTKFNENYKN